MLQKLILENNAIKMYFKHKNIKKEIEDTALFIADQPNLSVEALVADLTSEDLSVLVARRVSQKIVQAGKCLTTLVTPVRVIYLELESCVLIIFSGDLISTTYESLAPCALPHVIRSERLW